MRKCLLILDGGLFCGTAPCLTYIAVVELDLAVIELNLAEVELNLAVVELDQAVHMWSSLT